MYPPHRLDPMAGMHPMLPYNMVPYYQQQFVGAPLQSGVGMATARDTQQNKGADPETAIQVC